MYETLREAGYIHSGYNPETKEHKLYNCGTEQVEIWFANKGHASYGLIYKNTNLEFARGAKNV